MQKYRLKNSFHGTSAQILVDSNPDDFDSIQAELAARAYAAHQGDEHERRIIRRARAKLCGIEGCTCGGEWGER